MDNGISLQDPSKIILGHLVPPSRDSLGHFLGGPQLPLLLLTERTWSGDDRVGLQRGEHGDADDDGDEYNISGSAIKWQFSRCT